MRFYTVKDYVTFKKLHRKLMDYPITPALRKLGSCMSRAQDSGVTIARKGHRVGFHGITYCHDAWCCPNCAPYKLNKIKHKLITGFEMLKKAGYKCCMVTYTVGHAQITTGNAQDYFERDYISLADTIYLLKNTMTKFLSTSRLLKYRTTDSPSFSIYEITWGYKNGWHPHIHYLIWLRPENFDKFTSTESEEKYRKSWIKAQLKIVDQMTWLPTRRRESWKDLISHPERSNVHGVHISRTSTGEAAEVNAQNYFWSGENEVADLLSKKGRLSNFTQWQILEKALSESPESEKYMNLFIEVVNAVRGIQQYRFKKGFLSAINEYEKIHKKEITTKKNCKEEKTEIICWLSQEQWNCLSKMGPKKLIILLASFAMQDDAFNLITEFCEVWNVPPPLKEPPYDLEKVIAA